MTQETSHVSLLEEVALVLAIAISYFAETLQSPLVAIGVALGLLAEFRVLARTRSLTHATGVAIGGGAVLLFALSAFISDFVFEVGPMFTFDRRVHLAMVGGTTGFVTAAGIYLLLSLWPAGRRRGN
jgi:hypothetical protein